VSSFAVAVTTLFAASHQPRAEAIVPSLSTGKVQDLASRLPPSIPLTWTVPGVHGRSSCKPVCGWEDQRPYLASGQAPTWSPRRPVASHSPTPPETPSGNRCYPVLQSRPALCASATRATRYISPKLQTVVVVLTTKMEGRIVPPGLQAPPPLNT